MGTLKDQADYSLESKRLIKEAIKQKGVSVSDTDTFRSYAGKIDSIQASEPVDIEAKKTITISENKTTTVLPTSPHEAMSEVEVITDVPVKKIEPSKSQDVTENGTYTLSPSEGFDGIESATLNVNVAGGSSEGGIPNGWCLLKFEITVYIMVDVMVDGKYGAFDIYQIDESDDTRKEYHYMTFKCPIPNGNKDYRIFILVLIYY